MDMNKTYIMSNCTLRKYSITGLVHIIIMTIVTKYITYWHDINQRRNKTNSIVTVLPYSYSINTSVGFPTFIISTTSEILCQILYRSQ